MKIKESVSYLLIMVIGLAAGAGCYHRILQAEAAQEKSRTCEIRTVTYHESTVPEPELDAYRDKLTMRKESRDDLAQEAYYDELELLACCVEAEAGNQSVLGKRLVVDVILNRVEDPDFPDTIEGVITQEGQFTTWSNGAIGRVSPSADTYEAVKLELAGRLCRDIYYFTAGGYGAYGSPWEQVGDHYFCRK